MPLGDDNNDGHWSDKLIIQATMNRVVEQYRIHLRCETRDTSLGSERDLDVIFQAIQGSHYVGDFTLDYIPLSIVYCPPNQDMSNSLEQSVSYGTRMTIGKSESFEALSGIHGKVNALGLELGGVHISNSRSTSNRSEVGIQTSHFRKSIITADNSRAIGPSYWGPLGDLFVILVNPEFQIHKRIDETLVYSCTDIQEVIVAPAHKLLLPGNDPITSQIPEDVRYKLLNLDPFIKNLSRFFGRQELLIGFKGYDEDWIGTDSLGTVRETFSPPDWGIGSHQKLSDNGSYILYYEVIDPNPETPQRESLVVEFNRIEVLDDQDWIGAGDLYFQGSVDGVNTGWSEEFTVNPGQEIILEGDKWRKEVQGMESDPDIELWEAANPYADPTGKNRAECIGRWWLDNGTELNYSKGETRELMSRDTNEVEWQAKLTHERELDFDLFGLIGFKGITETSFMTTVGFQRSYETEVGEISSASCFLIRNQNEEDLEGIEIYYDKIFSTFMFRKVRPDPMVTGVIKSRPFATLGGIPVYLMAESGIMYSNVTDAAGRYRFVNIPPGKYLLSAGNKSARVELKDAKSIIRHDFKDVKRVLNLEKAAIWEVTSTLGISSEVADRIGAQLSKIASEDDIADLCGFSKDKMRQILNKVVLRWPGLSLRYIKSINKTHREKLEKLGIRTTKELLNSVSTPRIRKWLERSTGIQSKVILEWAKLADLMRIKSISEKHFLLLKEAGIDTLIKLQGQEVKRLHKTLQQINKKKQIFAEPPSQSDVKAWIDEATRMKRVVRMPSSRNRK